MESTSLVLSIVSIANMGILGILISMFGRMYGKTRAQLPLGMIVVAGMLFLHNVLVHWPISQWKKFSLMKYFHIC